MKVGGWRASMLYFINDHIQLFSVALETRKYEIHCRESTGRLYCRKIREELSS
jgi:hypothetical protein